MRDIIFLAAILVGTAGCSPPQESGQEGASGLVGAWLITETTTTTADSSWTDPTPQTGLYIFTETHFSNMLIDSSEPRQLFPVPFPDAATPEQRLAAYDPFIADAGSYQITDSTLTTENIIAKVPNVMNVALNYRYALRGDSFTLTLTGGWAPPDGELTYQLVRLRQDGR